MSQGDGKTQQTSKHTASKPTQLGSYQVLERIGSGGMGNVYKAVHVGLDRQVALKILPTQYARNPRLLARFRREAKAAAALEHENIVAIHDQGEINGVCYIAMELVEGEDLADRIQRKGRLSTRESVEIVKQAARALGHAHSRGIIHRDIKPSNLLMRKRDGVVKLADMGLAQRLRDEESEAQVTRDGTTVGTVDYMAPEQARDSKQADARSDLYALGCTWYHMLTGQPPFPGGTIIEKLLHHCQDDPADPRQFNPEITESMVAILKRMLKKSPAERYQGVGELLADLENVSFEPQASPKISFESEATPYALQSLGEAGETLSETQGAAPTPLPECLAPISQRHSSRKRSARRNSASSLPARRSSKRISTSRKQQRAAKGSRGTVVKILGATGGLIVLAVTLMLILSRKDESASTTSATLFVTTDNSQGFVNPASSGNVEKSATAPRTKRSHSEFAPSWKSAAFVKTPSRVVQVARGSSNSAHYYSSLTAALKSLGKNGGVVEIADNGPLFEPGIDVSDKGKVILRAAEGFHPTVVFEPEQNPDRSALLNTEGTDVQLEGIHFIVQANGSAQTQSPALFDIRSGDLLARGCTFTVLGEDTGATAWTVFRLRSGKPGGPTRVGLDSCHLRGSIAGGLVLEAQSVDVLLENTLFVLGSGPAIEMNQQVPPGADAERVVRVIASTLISLGDLFILRSGSDFELACPTRFLVADSVLACPASATGTRMLQLENWPIASDGRLSDLTWKSENVFYAGWEELVSNTASARPLAKNLVEWSQLWQTLPGAELFASGGWPIEQIGEPARAPASFFDAASLSEGVSTQGQAKILGVAIERLQQPPFGWFERSLGWFDRVPRPVQLTPLQKRAAGKGVFDQGVAFRRLNKKGQAEVAMRVAKREGREPPVAPDADLIINADQQDVGETLAQADLADDALVVITGSGEHPSSPIRAQNRSLRLRFISTGNDELILTPKEDAQALIEVVAGNLEVEGAGFGLDARTTTIPRWFVRVEGGNLTLRNCRLRGPVNDNSTFEAAVCWQRGDRFPLTRPKAGDSPLPVIYDGYCIVSDCFLVGTGRLIDADMRGRAMFLENNVFVARNDFLRLGIEGDLGTFGAYVELIRNTACLLGGGTFFEVPPSGYDGEASGPLRFFSQDNLFCKAFDLTPEKPSLLRYDDSDLHRNRLVWQETSNAYWRLGRYLGTASGDDESQQEFRKDWVRTWGLAHVKDFSVGLVPDFEARRFREERSMPEDFALRSPSEVPAGVGADVTRLAAPSKPSKPRASSKNDPRSRQPGTRTRKSRRPR